MTWAQRQNVGSTGAKFVLFVMADYADEDGICWPSQEVLAETTEQSIRSIIRHIEMLSAGGWIARVGRHDEGEANSGRRNGRQVYRLLAPSEILNPKGARREKRHDTVSRRQQTETAVDDVTNCRVDSPKISPQVASGPDAPDAVPRDENDVPNCHLENKNDVTTTTERCDNHDKTTCQIRHRSIEEPSSDPSGIHHPPLPDPDAAREAGSGEAVKVIAEFDRSLVQHFGAERARAWPGAVDRVTAQRWLDAGADLALAADVFNARHARMAAAGEDPPRSLRFHDLAMADAIKAAHRPMPEGSGFASGLPPSVYDRQIEDAVKKALGGTVS